MCARHTGRYQQRWMNGLFAGCTPVEQDCFCNGDRRTFAVFSLSLRYFGSGWEDILLRYWTSMSAQGSVADAFFFRKERTWPQRL